MDELTRLTTELAFWYSRFRNYKKFPLSNEELKEFDTMIDGFIEELRVMSINSGEDVEISYLKAKASLEALKNHSNKIYYPKSCINQTENKENGTKR